MIDGLGKNYNDGIDLRADRKKKLWSVAVTWAKNYRKDRKMIGDDRKGIECLENDRMIGKWSDDRMIVQLKNDFKMMKRLKKWCKMLEWLKLDVDREKKIKGV
jgi:hypothetical protein